MTKLSMLGEGGGGVNRFSDRRISPKKLFGFWIWRIFYKDSPILLIQRIAYFSYILAQVVDLKFSSDSGL